MEENEETEELNMNAYMDVVMVYKCKFCDVTCSTPRQMATHLKTDHVFLTNTGAYQKVKQQNNELPVDGNDMTTSDQLTIVTDDDILAESPISTQASHAVPTQEQTTNNSEPGAQEDPIGNGEQYTLTSQSSMEGNSQLNTKLLYVCGQCSVGFNSIDYCKEHMIESHGHTDSTVEVEAQENTGKSSPVGIGTTSSQVSVGTQMEPKKKPGRKRKTEVKVEPVPVSSEESESEDEDWVPENRLGRSRRKIRTPRALKEVYYIGKKKKKHKRSRICTEKDFIHKCHHWGCMAKFKSLENIAIHISCHSSLDEGFICPECKDRFSAWRALRIHLYRRHDIDLDLSTCDICGFKIDTMNKLRVHKEIHSDSRPYTCDICGKGFRQYSQMKNHQLVHSQYQKKPQEAPVVCTICERSFVNKKCLLKHEQTVHCEIKQYKCSECNYASSRKAMLNLHLRTHTGEKPYKCDLCAYASGDHNSLRRHKMRHTGQKQYKCTYCPYTCIQAISLKSHMKAKHPGSEFSFTCELCNFQSVNKVSFDNHMSDHKNGLVVNRPRGRMKSTIISQTDIGENEYLNFAADNQESMQVKMHVQTMKTGEAQVSAEDLAKLSCYEGLMTGEASAAQLIYSALNAIAQSEKTGVPQTAELLGGVQCTTLSADCEEGVTSHTITFHLPANFQNGEQQEVTETVLFGQPVEIIETVDESAVEFIESNITDSTVQTVDRNGNLVTMGIVVGADVENHGQSVSATGEYTEGTGNSNEETFVVINHDDVSNQGFEVSNEDFQAPNHDIQESNQEFPQSRQELLESNKQFQENRQEEWGPQKEVPRQPELLEEEMSTDIQSDSNEIITIDLQQIAPDQE